MEKVLEILGNVGFDWRVALSSFVNFLIILFILKKFVFKDVARTLHTRRQKIEEGLAMREEAAKNLENAFAEKARIISDARDEESNIMKQAHEKAVSLRGEMLARAQGEAEGIVEHAHGELGRLKKDLHGEWTEKAPRLVVALTEKILKEKFSANVNEAYVKNLLR